MTPPPPVPAVTYHQTAYSPPRLPLPTTNLPNTDTNTSISQSLRLSHLLARLLGDVIVAATVTLFVAPCMTVIDRAIVEKAATNKPMLSSIKTSVIEMATKPTDYVKSPMFLMMWATYGLTYSAANTLRTLTDVYNTAPAVTQTTLFVGTTVVNSSATMMKDRAYATMFGGSAAPAAIPKLTYACWAMRDFMVIGSSFILPDISKKYLINNFNLDEVAAGRFSQLACPVATQLVAGPVQLLGLDLYNRPLKNLSMTATITSRWNFQVVNFKGIVAARVARIAPAYGIGGIGNTYLRDAYNDALYEREVEKLQDSAGYDASVVEMVVKRAKRKVKTEPEPYIVPQAHNS